MPYWPYWRNTDNTDNNTEHKAIYYSSTNAFSYGDFKDYFVLGKYKIINHPGLFTFAFMSCLGWNNECTKCRPAGLLFTGNLSCHLLPFQGCTHVITVL